MYCQLEHVQILMTVTVIQGKMWSTDWQTDLLCFKGTIKIVSNRLKSKGAFLWDGPDQDEHSKITQKWKINKRNLWILQCSLEWIQARELQSFDAAWFEGFWIIDTKGLHPIRLTLMIETWRPSYLDTRLCCTTWTQKNFLGNTCYPTVEEDWYMTAVEFVFHHHMSQCNSPRLPRMTNHHQLDGT